MLQTGLICSPSFHSSVFPRAYWLQVTSPESSRTPRKFVNLHKKYLRKNSEKYPNKKFHDPLNKQKLKTFNDVAVGKTCQAGAKQVIVKADLNLSEKIIPIRQTRYLNITDVLSHPLSPISWALDSPERTLRKTKYSSSGRNA